MKAEDIHKSEEQLRKLIGSSEGAMKTPDGYFDQMASELMYKTEGISAVKEDAFQVPSYYFEQLPVQISDRIANKKKAVPVFFHKRLLVPVSLAALICIGVLIRSYITTTVPPETETITAQDLHESGVLMDIDEDALIDQLADQTDAGNTSTDSLTQYLIENNIDISQLEIQL